MDSGVARSSARFGVLSHCVAGSRPPNVSSAIRVMSATRTTRSDAAVSSGRLSLMSLCAVLSGVRRTRKMSFLETSRYRTISSTTRAVTPLRMIAIFAAAGFSRTTNAVKPVGLLPGARRNRLAECFGFMCSPPEILTPYRKICNSHSGDLARSAVCSRWPMKLLVIVALVVVPGCASTLPGRGDPTAATVAFSRAIAHQLQGRHDDAIQEYDQAIRLRPEYAEASTTAAQPTTASANTTGRSRISNAPTKVDHSSRRPSRSARARSASTTLPDRIWTDCPDPASDEERQRLLDQFRKAAEELSAPGAVEGAVVAREGQH